jgi:fatty acid desaturase
MATLLAARDGVDADDELASGPPVALPAGTLRELSRIDPLRSLAHVALEWMGIAAAIALSERFFSVPLYIVAVLWIAARQHALAILMHEGAHFRLFRSRFLNDAASELLLAWPLLMTTRAYRRSHFAHHRHVNTVEDPDWVRKQTEEWAFPKDRRDLAWMLFKDASGLSLPRWALMVVALSGLAGRAEVRRTLAEWPLLVARALCLAAATAAAVRLDLGRPLLLYWFIPLWTWFLAIMHIRSIAEHFAIDDERALTRTRTTYPSLLERLFVCPKNIGYHLDHHLFPSVPFHRLPELHATLLADEEFRRRAHITRTYLGVLAECTAR